MSTSSSSRLCDSLSTSGCFLFDFRRFSSHLTTLFLGRSLCFYPVLDSTQALALKELSNNQFCSGHVILADRQLAGRGRFSSRQWFSSPESSNLSFTSCLRLTSPAALPLLNFTVSLAVAEAIRCSTVNQVKATVKWPNDILIGQRKVSGILIDVTTLSQGLDGSQDFGAAVGIGINVYGKFKGEEALELQSSAISVSEALEEAGVEHASGGLRELILANFLNCFEQNLQSTWESLKKKYLEFSAINKQTHLLVMPNKKENLEGSFNATFDNLTDDGFLRVRKEDGQLVTLVAEEVSIKLKQ
jgi:BirA family biotin operon repressor/biotin-[acetyl-CoA-carboxylase] ligase